jgi:hypothetical protein
MNHTLLLLGAALAVAPVALSAQSARRVAPICIGDCANVAGLRLNFRDRKLEQVHGLNVTVLGPKQPASGDVHGIALGVISTGAGNISGLAAAPLGLTVNESLHGIGVAGIGAGIGGGGHGILISGIGSGVGGSFRGATISGIGVAGGGSMHGLTVAGVGVGMGGSLNGLTVAGVGLGVGGSIRGLTVTGIGIGSGGDISGINLAGVGIGSGGKVSGLTITGVGVGARKGVDGVTISGVGIASTSVRRIAVAPFIGTADARGLLIAPAYLRLTEGEIRGISVSSVNDIRGHQRGLAIGIVNYARSLKGMQLGLINIVNDDRGPKVLPVVNWR